MEGEYGIDGVYLGVMAEVGAGGIRHIVEEALTDEEQTALVEAAGAVKTKVADLKQISI
jgi:malate dehydrogenase